MDAGIARWLGLLAEYDERSDVGSDPFERWVAWRFGVTYGEAAELVRVALRELPAMRHRRTPRPRPNHRGTHVDRPPAHIAY